MNETAGSMGRAEILAGCAGMNPARAEALLAMLPELGRVSTSHVLRLADLSAAHDAKELDIAKKKALQIQRLLVESLKEVLQDKEGKLAGVLRHLAENHRRERTRVCLAAVLRWYSDILRHPAAGADTEAYPDAGEPDLLAAEGTRVNHDSDFY